MIHTSPCIFADREGNRDPQLLLRHKQRSSSTQEPIGGLRPGHFLLEELWYVTLGCDPTRASAIDVA
jgi:hypothetical protein